MRHIPTLKQTQLCAPRPNHLIDCARLQSGVPAFATTNSLSLLIRTSQSLRESSTNISVGSTLGHSKAPYEVWEHDISQRYPIDWERLADSAATRAPLAEASLAVNSMQTDAILTDKPIRPAHRSKMSGYLRTYSRVRDSQRRCDADFCDQVNANG